MTYIKPIIKTLAVVVASSAVIYGTLLGENKLNNHESIELHSHSIMRGVGCFNTIELTRIYDPNNGYEKYELDYYNFLGKSQYITDGGAGKPDGLADEIILLGGGYTLGAIRDYDYKEYKKEFDEADKLLAETKKRLGNYLLK